jgi:hypothetical protein
LNYRLVFKKPVPQGLSTFKVPQTKGTPGWIVFTYDQKTPVCLWISNNECKKLPCIVDERICGDTFIKVEKIGPLDFVVSDIWMYNANCVFACSTFKQRYDWLYKLLKRFTTYIEGVTIDLIHKEDLGDIEIQGYEEHTNETAGKPGYFVEKDDSELVRVVRMAIPDCYEINGKGYVRVPDMKTSLYLRSKGDIFECKCIKKDDEFWELVENIPEVEVNAC